MKPLLFPADPADPAELAASKVELKDRFDDLVLRLDEWETGLRRICPKRCCATWGTWASTWARCEASTATPSQSRP